MYQETEGGADIAAFATLTLWLCAVESFCPPLIPESTNRLERTQSHGYGMTALSSLTRVKQMSTLQLDIDPATGQPGAAWEECALQAERVGRHAQKNGPEERPLGILEHVCRWSVALEPCHQLSAKENPPTHTVQVATYSTKRWR